jgi:hypothetical protein
MRRVSAAATQDSKATLRAAAPKQMSRPPALHRALRAAARRAARSDGEPRPAGPSVQDNPSTDGRLQVFALYETLASTSPIDQERRGGGATFPRKRTFSLGESQLPCPNEPAPTAG